MLKYFFHTPYRLRQLRRKPLCRYIETLAEKLRRLGFTRASGQRILGLVGKFNEFARSVGVENLDCIDEGLVERFFKDELPSQGTFTDAPAAMRHLLTHLRDEGFISKEVSTEVVDSFQPILDRYDYHLCNVCGLTESSRSNYLRYARRLLSWLQNRHGDRPLTELAGVDVVEFVTELAPLHPSGSWRNDLCSLTRVFLRFLRWEGIIQVDLARVVPKLPRWRMSNLARHLPWKQVRQLIDSVDISKRGGSRDKVVLLLIASLGLRRKEVCRLQLDHIAWREAEIRVAETKSRRERTLPLPQEVGAALVEYVLHERPRLPLPQVFLTNRAPLGPIAPRTVGSIVNMHLRRAGIQAPNHGTNLLRHSLATRLVNQGIPIKQIADLFGHASIDTTAIYTKVDTANLATVGLPFPGGEA